MKSSIAEFLERQLACELLPTAYHALQTSGSKLLERHSFSAFWLSLGLQLVTCLSHERIEAPVLQPRLDGSGREHCQLLELDEHVAG